MEQELIIQICLEHSNLEETLKEYCIKDMRMVKMCLESNIDLFIKLYRYLGRI